MRKKRPMFKYWTVAIVALVSHGISATGAPVDAGTAQQCALDICGDPKSFLNVTEMAETRKVVDPSIANDFNQKIKPSLETWLAASIENVKSQLQSSVSGVAELMKSPLTPNEIVINNLVWALGHKQLNNVLTAATASGAGRTIVDRTKAAAVLTGMSPSEQTYLIDYAEAIVNLPEYRELDFLASDTYANLMAIKYPYQSLKAAAQSDGQHFLDIQNELVAIDPNLNFLSWITKQNFVNLARGNEVVLNPDTQWRIAKARLNLALYHEVLAAGPNHDLFLKRPVTFDAAQLQAKINTVISHVKSIISDQSKLQTQKSKLMDGCLKSYNFALLAAPSDTDLKNIRLRIDAIKGFAQDVATEYAGPASANNVKGAVQGAEFLLPNVSSQVAPMWQRSIQAMMASDQQDANARTLPQWITRYSVDFVDDITDDAIFYSIGNLCSSLQPSGLSDHALTTLGKISLSWPTVKYPDFGAGVIAHEIGHVVSTAMAKAASSQFQDVRQCTVLRHLSPPNLTFYSNMNYIEEDWADTFAAQVLKRANGSMPATAKNFACIFLAKNGSTYGSSKEPISLENSNQSDTHSADFFRVIQVQLELGGLPASCQKAVASYSLFNRCGK